VGGAVGCKALAGFLAWQVLLPSPPLPPPLSPPPFVVDSPEYKLLERVARALEGSNGHLATIYTVVTDNAILTDDIDIQLTALRANGLPGQGLRCPGALMTETSRGGPPITSSHFYAVLVTSSPVKGEAKSSSNLSSS
jgi:hypothetical protein